MWAAGVSLYLLATGRVPFEGSSLIQLFERIAVGSYAETPQLAAQPQLQSLLRSLLCVAQQERLGAEEALAHPWLSPVSSGAAGAAGAGGSAWGETEHSLLLSLSARGARPVSVLRAIAQKYGEEFVEPAAAAPPSANQPHEFRPPDPGDVLAGAAGEAGADPPPGAGGEERHPASRICFGEGERGPGRGAAGEPSSPCNCSGVAAGEALAPAKHVRGGAGPAAAWARPQREERSYGSTGQSTRDSLEERQKDCTLC
mmetsp:Transcript_33374/g.107223  ORF Transcript_33374/g.107223 Transcript_33374/m.107223 type:complete len:257 (-) Transcript_33374:100-870(-)